MSLNRGRIAKPLEIRGIRELTRDDLGCLREKRDVQAVAKLRQSHHLLARLLALGIRPEEAAYKSGYSLSRVYVLQADPTFNNLVTAYSKDVDASWREATDDYAQLVTENMIRAERMISDKLDEAEEEDGPKLSVRELVTIGRDAADRMGYGKKTTNTNLNVDLAARIEGAIKRSGKVIDVTPQVVRRV
jgi:hypothetical protein